MSNKVLGAISFLLLISSTIFSQTGSFRDERSVLVLSQMGQRTGWWNAAVHIPVVVTGRYTLADGTTNKFSLSLTGTGDFKEEVSTATGITVSSGTGSHGSTVQNGRKSIERAGRQVSPPTLPFAIGVLANPPDSFGLEYLGVENWKGEQAYKISILESSSGGIVSASGRRTVWISTSTLMPLAVEYCVPADNNPGACLKRKRYLKSYQVVGALAIPYSQQDFVGGKVAYTLEIDQVTFGKSASNGGQQ